MNVYINHIKSLLNHLWALTSLKQKKRFNLPMLTVLWFFLFVCLFVFPVTFWPLYVTLSSSIPLRRGWLCGLLLTFCILQTPENAQSLSTTTLLASGFHIWTGHCTRDRTLSDWLNSLTSTTFYFTFTDPCYRTFSCDTLGEVV